MAPESYIATAYGRIGGSCSAARRTNRSENHDRWPISQSSGFTVGSMGADELIVGHIDDDVHRALPGVAHSLRQLLGGQRVGGGQVRTHRRSSGRGAARPTVG